MLTTNRITFATIIILLALLPALVACSDGQQQARQKYNVVISELMPSNRTGLINGSNSPTDWIEIKNNGNSPIDLEDFTLVVKKNSADDQSQSTADKKKDKTRKWTFPAVKIDAGEYLVVFADKTNDSIPGNSLQANLKLPKEGATVQLLSPDDSVLSEVSYSAMEPDQSLALQSDNAYTATFWQSPGFENSRKGYEAANQRIDSLRNAPVLIWELMSRAPHSYENWVELKNVSDSPVDLSAYSLSKKMGKEEAWQLPAKTLAPGEIISYQLVGRKAGKGNAQQAPFKVGDAETIVLSKNGKFVDGMCARLTPYGGSVGRLPGRKGLFYFTSPTRGKENDKSGMRYIAEKPLWNQAPGIYKDQKNLCLKLKDPERKVHYTLDGSEPTVNSPVVRDSIVINKPTVVRCFAEGDSATLRSNIATATYLIGVDHDLPVVNISLNQGDFYNSSNGIYANGPGYGGEFPYFGANFWKNWTKKAHVELFDGDKKFASDCGLKIFGGYSRALPKKSLRIKFRGQFGDSKVNYDFFNTGQPLDIEDLVLRSGSQDYNRYMIKDEFFTSLARTDSTSLLSQLYRPVAVYINAEYFGLYYLREKIDKNFVARKLNLPNDSIDLHLSGPSQYKTLENRIAGLDMTKSENFKLAQDNIDLQGLIDYKIGNIFSGKWDTGNIRYARSRHPKSDRKWRFVYYDIDASWSRSGTPKAAFSLSMSPDVLPPEKARHNVLINSMLRNSDFRQMFLERLAYHLANAYSVKNTTAHFDKFIDQIRNEMKLNCQRWKGLSYAQWEKNIKEFRARLETRPKIILDDLRRYLSITDAENQKHFSSLGY